MERVFSTRQDAIEFEIEHPINAGDADSMDYNIEKIADQCIIEENGKYFFDNTVNFWDIVKNFPKSHSLTIFYSVDNPRAIIKWNFKDEENIVLANGNFSPTIKSDSMIDLYEEMTEIIANFCEMDFEYRGDGHYKIDNQEGWNINVKNWNS